MSKTEKAGQSINDGLTKKQRIELKRQERRKAQARELRKKQIKRAVPWILLILGIIVLISWFSAMVKKERKEMMGEAVPIMGRNHIRVGDEHEPYNSNPPTSGPHAEAKLWGFNDGEIPDENAIHNLEHGGIWISYKDLSEDEVEKLRKIARANSQSVIVSKREANDSRIAVASWGRLMKLDTVDEVKINKFIRQNKNKSPERLAR